MYVFLNGVAIEKTIYIHVFSLQKYSCALYSLCVLVSFITLTFIEPS